MKNDKKYIASRTWNPVTKQTFYVANLPGHEGVDWGYTKERSKALPLSRYWARRFSAHCARCSDMASITEA
jgi:hypothetical protein